VDPSRISVADNDLQSHSRSQGMRCVALRCGVLRYAAKTTQDAARCRTFIEGHRKSHHGSMNHIRLGLQVGVSAVQGPASGGMNIGGGGPVQSRKRKLDSSPPDSPSSASPDEDSSGGDGTSCTSLQLTPSKVLRPSLS